MRGRLTTIVADENTANTPLRTENVNPQVLRYASETLVGILIRKEQNILFKRGMSENKTPQLISPLIFPSTRTIEDSLNL